jgi:hypothetical protein
MIPRPILHVPRRTLGGSLAASGAQRCEWPIRGSGWERTHAVFVTALEGPRQNGHGGMVLSKLLDLRSFTMHKCVVTVLVTPRHIHLQFEQLGV